MSRTPTAGPLTEVNELSAFSDSTATNARYALVQGIRVFYREAGRSSAPTLLLLHGFPTSSHMYRSLLPILATQYHVIAPDMPGFGFTEAPDRERYRYSFDNLARTMDALMDTLGLSEYAIQVFDYGAPVGFRLALAHPERITALISQNGNAYEEGLSAGWDPIQRYWRAPSAANRSALRALLTPESVKWQYTHGVADPTRIAPETYVLDSALLTGPEVTEIQLDLFRDYANNVALYPAFQHYFRSYKPPLLAVWGQNDPFFCPLAPTHLHATSPTPKYTCTIPVISRSKPIAKKSAQPFLTFSTGCCRSAPLPLLRVISSLQWVAPNRLAAWESTPRRSDECAWCLAKPCTAIRR